MRSCYITNLGDKIVDNIQLIDRSSCVSLIPNLILKEEPDNWAILYNPEDGYSFGINPVSVVILKHLQEKSKVNVSELFPIVKKAFQNATGNIETDVEKFLNKLLERKLVYVETP